MTFTHTYKNTPCEIIPLEGYPDHVLIARCEEEREAGLMVHICDLSPL
jgi:hypothetical protein